jgi:hypothetical protein
VCVVVSQCVSECVCVVLCELCVLEGTIALRRFVNFTLVVQVQQDQLHHDVRRPYPGDHGRDSKEHPKASFRDHVSRYITKCD